MAVNVTLLPVNGIYQVACAQQYPTHPALNVLNKHRFRYLLTQVATEVVIDCDLNNEYAVDGVVLYSTLDPGQTEIEIELYKNFSYDSANLIETVTSKVMTELVEPEWRPFEKFGDYHRNDVTKDSWKMTTIYFSGAVSSNLRIKIKSTGLTEMKIAHIHAGPMIRPVTNVSAEYSVSIDPLSTIVHGSQGDPISGNMGSVKRLKLEWPLLTDNERQRMMMTLGALGNHKKIVVDVHPGDTGYKRHVDGIIGVVDEPFVAVRRKDSKGEIWTGSMSVQAPYIALN